MTKQTKLERVRARLAKNARRDDLSWTDAMASLHRAIGNGDAFDAARASDERAKRKGFPFAPTSVKEAKDLAAKLGPLKVRTER